MVRQSSAMYGWNWTEGSDLGSQVFGQALLESCELSSQTALGVIGNIAFPLGENKGKNLSFTFTGDEFNQSPPVAPRLSTNNDRNVLLRLSQTAPIELMFGGVW